MKYEELFEEGVFNDGETPDDPEALSRITVKENSDVAMWAGEPRALMHWLTNHPQATAIVGRWFCTISSPVLDDVFELERFDPPFGLNSAVDGFDVGRDDGGFAATWSLS